MLLIAREPGHRLSHRAEDRAVVWKRLVRRVCLEKKKEKETAIRGHKTTPKAPPKAPKVCQSADEAAGGEKGRSNGLAVNDESTTSQSDTVNDESLSTGVHLGTSATTPVGGTGGSLVQLIQRMLYHHRRRRP